jgi:hypothetical protein
MSTAHPPDESVERVPTVIRGIDTNLFGGVLRGGATSQGPPSASRPSSSTNSASTHIASGGRAIYITLLAESHSRMMQKRPLPCASSAFTRPSPKSLYVRESRFCSSKSRGSGHLAVWRLAEVN